MYKNFNDELNWVIQNMPRTKLAISKLPDLTGVRLACNMHLDLKMIPIVVGLLKKGAKVFLSTCNPTTVQDDVVEYLKQQGAEGYAWRDMTDAEWSESFDKALAWKPSHLCEVGGDLTARLHQSGFDLSIKAGLEATGSGISRLNTILKNESPKYPIFNWDDLPIKEGLHNRHMVGLVAWHTFFQTTRLTLHEKYVAVIGYGLVGQGVAASAKAYGGQVVIVETDPTRALQAKYDGWVVCKLEEAVLKVDVIATATGAHNVLSKKYLANTKDGVFILNVGHIANEIDVPFLKSFPNSEPMPFVSAYHMDNKTIYLLANGSMFNLTAGYGDSLNAFDVTAAVMASGINYIIGKGSNELAGLYLLPEDSWKSVL